MRDPRAMARRSPVEIPAEQAETPLRFIRQLLELDSDFAEGVLDSIRRLERIALAHAVDPDDIDARLTELEAKPRRKPQ